MISTILALDIMETRPNLARTTTSRNADEIESELFKELRKMAKQLLGKDVNYLPDSDKTTIRDLIRNYIQDAYLEGMDYNWRKMNTNTNLTKRDLDRIEDITKTTFDAFIKALQNPKVIIEQFDDLPELDRTRIILANLEDADATRRKMLIDILNGITTATLGVNLMFNEPSLARLASTGIVKSLNFGTLVNSSDEVEFVTRRDDRVCPICEPLDGNRYFVDPITRMIRDGPTIPDDTHPNCRCRYLSISGEDVIVG